MKIEGRPSHKAIILEYLKQNGTITKGDGWDKWRFGDTTQRIKDLREEGWLIVSEKPRIKGQHHAVYRLLGRIDEEGGVTNDTFK